MLIDSSVHSEIEPLVKRVLEYHYGPEDEPLSEQEPELIEVFVTEPGRMLGDQADGLMALSLKFLGLCMLPTFASLPQKARKIVESGEMQGISPEDLLKLDFGTVLRTKGPTSSVEHHETALD